MPGGEATIEVVRALSTDSRSDEIVRLLTGEGELNEDAARRWASEAVCVAIEAGSVVGVGAVRPARLRLLGGRPFWTYRSFFRQGHGQHWNRMFSRAFEVLAKRLDAGEASCVGVCALIEERSPVGASPEAVWPDTQLVSAGYLGDGRQVRIRYFWDAAIGPGLPDSPSEDEILEQEYPLEEPYRIQHLAEGGNLAAEDVLRLWGNERAVPEGEARRRVSEVQLVAIEPDNGVVGVSTVWLQRNPQLRVNLWYYRTYVARAHRESNLAAHLLLRNWELMERRFITGEDRRGAGMIFELENEALKRHFNKARMLADFIFVGENERGDHIRIRYFPGARVPLPEPALVS